MSRLPRLLRRLLTYVVVAAAAAILTWAFLSRKQQGLEAWHREAPAAEWRADEIGPDTTLAAYLAREDEILREVHERVEQRLEPGLQVLLNRYFAGSPLNPARFAGPNWNRTYEFTPGDVRGGALLIHGMSDSPYSMRALARICEDAGFYALAMRMPGHGTVPAGLAQADWRGWAAAVRLGVRHVHHTVGEGKPIVVFGYSNGGALALNYAIEALQQQALPRPSRLVLVSPMVGVTPFAALSRLLPLLSGVPYFEQSAWTSVSLEYNPFKYNSFPVNGGLQSHLVTRALDRGLTRLSEEGRLGELPPILTFQSVVDATVLTDAVVTRLYDRLDANGSELAMFDLARRDVLMAALRPEAIGLFKNLFRNQPRRYRLSVVTTSSGESMDVVEKDIAPGRLDIVTRDLGLSWPRGVYSLSHVALPFRPDDPLYGLEPDLREDYGIRLGQLQMHGERGVLTVADADLMRLGSNPFFPYLEERTRQWLASAAAEQR